MVNMFKNPSLKYSKYGIRHFKSGKYRNPASNYEKLFWLCLENVEQIRVLTVLLVLSNFCANFTKKKKYLFFSEF